MSKVIHTLNDTSKSWKIHSYNIQSVSGDNLNLTASDNNNIYLNVSGGLVNTTYLDVSNNLRVYGNAVFANHLQTDNSSVKIPNTYNNYAFANHADLLTNLTKTGNTWIDLSGSGYIVNYTPLSNNSKLFLHGKISYIASAESEQFISFQLLRVINNTETVLFSDMSFGSEFGTIQNGIYNFDYVDSPDSSANITYYLKYKIYDDGNNIDISSGVLGYDNSNINCFMAQELYIPSMDGIIQTVNTSLGNVFLDNRDASFNNVDILGTLEVSNNLLVLGDASINNMLEVSNNLLVLGDASINNMLEVSNNLLVLGDASINNMLEVSNNLLVLGDASINNMLEVSNNFLVKGNSQLGNLYYQKNSITHYQDINDTSTNYAIKIAANGHVKINCHNGKEIQFLHEDNTLMSIDSNGNVDISRSLTIEGEKINTKVYMRMSPDASYGSSGNTEFTISSWDISSALTSHNGLYQDNNDIFRPPRNGIYFINFNSSVKSATHNSSYAEITLQKYNTNTLIWDDMAISEEKEANVSNQDPKSRFLSVTTILELNTSDKLRINARVDNNWEILGAPHSIFTVYNVD